MKKTELSPERQKFLVSIPEYPGAFGLIPPPSPRYLPLPGLQGEVTRAHEALGQLKAATASLPNPNLVTRTFGRREAVRSSQIEGTSTEIDELLAYEATGDEEGLPPDVVVTLNYVKALEYGLEQVKEKGGIRALNCCLIRGLHAHLLGGVKWHSGMPGEFRHKQNWIGGFRIYDAKFVPPPCSAIQNCMDDLVTLLQYAPDEEEHFEIPIVIRMAIAHAQFETIHPFSDGNGRVGRLFLPLMLAAEGYPPVYLAGFLKANQQIYYDCLSAVQLRGEWFDWIRFFATGVELASKESVRTADDLQVIMKKWTDIVGGMGLRSDAAIHRVPELLIGTPVLTIRQAADKLSISFPAASSAMSKLEKAGVVEQIKGKEQLRNRTFVAKEVVDLLDRPTDSPH